ncbi:peroxiredoxin [Hyphomicrobiales bacterium]|jgi:glutaredoxin/glutathione-dependent peroxiredoxin|nr:peroxiredoxin [Alphaproteobacteria bacterium]MDC0474540.1 peroxiredoxin [Hyphomicrobiales bacterium]MBT5663129.1 peroxiredoxin [Alphaproteobacteria bacterium]MDG1152628.1 peroxiredoxin [Hyphomicrobiales bacterium]MDG1523905.1 peroxiredoxin [Hyphomicrobiales bacterium]
MTIKEGDKLPEVTLHHMTENGPTPITTSELFGGKKSVLFAVPGAFTPGCSMQHLPGFVSNSDEILSKGVDQIVCLSVNDSFVMDAWGKDKGTGDKILMLGDGNGDFTEATGLTMDGSGFGLGSRSLRYSMIVDDNSVTKLNLESNPGEIAESSAENILEQL